MRSGGEEHHAHRNKQSMAKKLFVGNLPYRVADDELREMFSQVGTVDSAQVISDKFSGRSKGFGFVEMSTDEEAQAAVDKYNGMDMDGRALVVNPARPKTDRPRGGFGGRRDSDSNEGY